MLALVNPRPAAATDGPRNTSTTTMLPRHLLSGRDHGPDAGRAPRHLTMKKKKSSGIHRDDNNTSSTMKTSHTMTSERERDADGDSFDNVFLGFDDNGGGFGDDDDAIPLVPLGQMRSSTNTAPATAAAAKGKRAEARGGGGGGGGEDKENDGVERSGARKKRRRVYQYVSHGIGGAGNFRKVLTSLRSDNTTTDPSFARNNEQQRSSSGTGTGRSTICSCSRCFSAKKLQGSGSGSGSSTSTSSSQIVNRTPPPTSAGNSGSSATTRA